MSHSLFEEISDAASEKDASHVFAFGKQFRGKRHRDATSLDRFGWGIVLGFEDLLGTFDALGSYIQER